MLWQSNWSQLSPNQLHVGLAGIAAQRSADMQSLGRAAFCALGGMTRAEFDNLGKLFGPSWGWGCRWARGRGEKRKGGVPWILCIFLGRESCRLVSIMEDGDAGCVLMIPDPGRTPEGTG
ncbi:hypothetical protein GGI42DRAFT_307729 [Trichoderma sp. SZMC 28013]